MEVRSEHTRELHFIAAVEGVDKFTSSAAASPGWQPGHGSSFRIAWRAALTLFAPGTAGAKTMLRRSFDPVPPETFYASVWAGVESMMTLRCPRAAA